MASHYCIKCVRCGAVAQIPGRSESGFKIGTEVRTVVTKHDGTLTDLPKGKDSASTQARNQAMKEHRIFHLEVVTCTNCGTWSEQSVKVPILGCLLRGVIACGLPYVLIKLAGLEVSLAVGISFGLAWLWQWWDVRSREKKRACPNCGAGATRSLRRIGSIPLPCHSCGQRSVLVTIS